MSKKPLMEKQKINLLGLPFDGKSSFLKGPSEAPIYIRNMLHDGSSNYMSENGVDILKQIDLKDFGDIEILEYQDIESQISSLLDLSVPSIFLIVYSRPRHKGLLSLSTTAGSVISIFPLVALTKITLSSTVKVILEFIV